MLRVFPGTLQGGRRVVSASGGLRSRHRRVIHIRTVNTRTVIVFAVHTASGQPLGETAIGWTQFPLPRSWRWNEQIVCIFCAYVFSKLFLIYLFIYFFVFVDRIYHQSKCSALCNCFPPCHRIRSLWWPLRYEEEDWYCSPPPYVPWTMTRSSYPAAVCPFCDATTWLSADSYSLA